MNNDDFGKLLEDLCGADLDEITYDVNKSIAKKISQRPKFKLNDNLYYIKNSYNYFKETPKHYLSSNPNLKQEKLTNTPEWIEYWQNVLDCFDFDEFNQYLKNSSDEFMKTSLRFINTHIKLAVKRKDFKALFDVQSSKALYYIINSDFKNALREELKLFIIRLNPQSDDDIIFHEGVNEVNISNLNNLITVCEIKDFETLFCDVWSEVPLKKIYFNAPESMEILKKALKSDDFDNLNCEVEKNYFNC